MNKRLLHMVLAVGATAVAILCGEALLRLIRPNAMLPYTMQIYRDAIKKEPDPAEKRKLLGKIHKEIRLGL